MDSPSKKESKMIHISKGRVPGTIFEASSCGLYPLISEIKPPPVRSTLYRAPCNAVPAYLSAASETPDLRVEISGVLELVDDHAADVMQQ